MISGEIEVNQFQLIWETKFCDDPLVSTIYNF